MDEYSFDTTSELREYLAILKVRKWTILLTVLIALIVALAFSFSQTPMFEAQARVVVDPPGEDSAGGVPGLVDTETEKELVRSEPVASIVSSDLGLDQPPSTLLRSLSVDVVTGSRVLAIAYAAPQAAQARDIANGFANAYIEYRRQQTLQILNAERESVEEEIQNLSAEMEQLTDKQEEAEKSGNEALSASLGTSLNILQAQLGVLQQELSNLQPDAAALGGSSIIETAKLPTRPSSPNHLTNGILAVLLGLPLGIGVALVRERLDNRFRGTDDVERMIDAPLLATVPRFNIKSKTTGRERLIVESQPKSIVSEAYKTLRTNLQFLLSQRQINSLVVTSPGAKEGKTATAANLAVALAQGGRRVILVSADLRRPALEDLFGLPHHQGLSEWLASDETDLWRLIRNPGIPNLRIFTSGATPPNPAELLGSPRFQQTLDKLEENSDIVLIDAPPVFPVADPAILSSRAGATILVVNALTTHRNAAARAKQELERAGGRVIGGVLNSFDPGESPYYAESSYYSSYYGDDRQQDHANGGRGAVKRSVARLLRR